MGFAAMLTEQFSQRAYLAGTGIALAAGVVGYFLVLRSQVFGADALSHVAFTGSLAALAAGVDLRVGLFAGCVVAAFALGLLGRRGRPDDIVIGSALAWVLGLGTFFLTLYTTGRSGRASGGAATVNVLFGSIYGLSAVQAWTALAIGVVTALATLVLARPLLFATVDEAAAVARGVAVRVLGLAFFVLVGVTAAEASQAVGALLLVGLLAAPAGAAALLTRSPWRALALSAVLALASMWLGLGVAYQLPTVPPSFAILAVATGGYLLAALRSWAQRGSGHARVVAWRR